MLEHFVYETNEEIESSTLMGLAVQAATAMENPELAHKLLDAWADIKAGETDEEIPLLSCDDAVALWAKVYAKGMKCDVSEAFEACDFDHFAEPCPAEFVQILARIEVGRAKAAQRYWAANRPGV